MANKTTEEKVLKWYEGFCKEYSLDPHSFDIFAETDRSLSASENINKIEQQLRLLVKPEMLLTRADVQSIKDEEKRRIKKEEEKIVTEFRNEKLKKLVTTRQTETIRDYINMVVKGHFPGLIIYGRTGLGKTLTVRNILRDLEADFVPQSGFTTPLALYKFMFENKNRLMVLDDLEGIFYDTKVISLLKAATGEVEGRRFVSYDTTSKAAEDTPSKFEITGKVIILCNEVNGNRTSENFKALLSRTLYFEMKMTQKEVMEACSRIIAESQLGDEQRDKVLEIIRNNITDLLEFNMRDLERLIQFVKYDINKAEKLFLASSDSNEDYALVLKLMQSDLKAKQRIGIFETECGKSRATFYRIVEKLKELLGDSLNVSPNEI